MMKINGILILADYNDHMTGIKFRIMKTQQVTKSKSLTHMSLVNPQHTH